MKYIFVNHATRYLFIDIINSFAENKQDVELLTGEIREGQVKISSSVKKKKFIRYNSSTAFKRLFTWIIFTFEVFIYLLFKKKTKSTLILVTTPPFLPFLGLIFRILFKLPYYVIVYDVYPDVLISFKVLKENSIIIKIWNFLNRELYKWAEKVFTISSFMAQKLIKQGCESKKILVVSNWVDSSFIKPIRKNENIFLKEHSYLDNKFVVIYSGNMGATHDIESLVYIAEKLEIYSDIHFLIIGEGIKKPKIEKMKKGKSLSNITILPLVPSNILPYSLTAGDLAYITLDNGAENASVPSKLYYMLAAGCGIISVVNENSEVAFLTKLYNFGGIFKPGAIDSICEFILECKNDEKILLKYKENARNAAFNFTPENSKLFYDSIIKDNH